ncbi:hypothetical protein EBR03_00610 [bacterium]|nr:hypothetical protein [bacterium]
MRKNGWIGLGVLFLVIGVASLKKTAKEKNEQSIASEKKDSATEMTSDPKATNPFVEIPNGGLMKVRTQGTIPPGYSSLKDFVERGLRDPERLEEERAFQQNGRQLIVLPGVLALAPEEVNPGASASGAFEHLGFSVVKTEGRGQVERGFPVVYDPQVGSLGIITGNVQVKYRDSARPEKWSAQYRMQLAQDFPDISLAFFTTQTKNMEALLELVENLRRENQVESVTLDVLEANSHPN